MLWLWFILLSCKKKDPESLITTMSLHDEVVSNKD